jgi:hypothetical protein
MKDAADQVQDALDELVVAVTGEEELTEELADRWNEKSICSLSVVRSLARCTRSWSHRLVKPVLSARAGSSSGWPVGTFTVYLLLDEAEEAFRWTTVEPGHSPA